MYKEMNMESDESDEYTSLEEVLNSSGSSSPARRAGRPRGSQQIPYTHADFQMAFECFMEECPKNVSGRSFLVTLQRRMPTLRTLSALQTFVSEKLRGKMRELVASKYGTNLRGLTIAQSMALRTYLSAGNVSRSSRNRKHTLHNYPALTLGNATHASFHQPLALPWRREPQQPMAPQREEEEAGTSKLPQTTPPTFKIAPRASLQQPLALLWKHEPKQPMAPQKKEEEAGPSKLQQTTPPVSTLFKEQFQPGATSTPQNMEAEEAPSDVFDEEMVDQSPITPLDARLSSESNSGIEGSLKGIEAIQNSRIGARLTNVTVLELFTISKKNKKKYTPFHVDQGENLLKVCHHSALLGNKGNWSTEAQTGHPSAQILEAKSDIVLNDVITNNIDPTYFTVEEDPEKKDITFQVGHIKGPDAHDDYPIMIVRKK